MSEDVRYEIGDEIARGDFATVYRGRDLRLERDVAIKQLHHQYLNDTKLTERYWQEAQILARLEHPHVMTIYDVVPERGWLILELMKGSLKDQLGQRPIHLKDLRLTILFAARALAFFQEQNILHGDVKPSNLLIDRNNVIKLGDFGIARRLQNDEGSAIKGTTRYIAPEVVSDKFGPVGPASDIYSLGFSAYELLCGERFETLFPGLHMFGRDQQLAWIMWHSAPDRRLPKIKDVLEGVPDQLAAVIERMTNKDPAQRYSSADQIIEDLSNENIVVGGGPTKEELEQAEREARQAKRKRILSIGALAISMTLCVAMLLPKGEAPPKIEPPAPEAGLVGKVDPERNRIYLKSQEVVVVNEGDLLLRDGVVCQLADLEPNDRLAIQYFDGGKTKRIQARRGESSHFVGRFVEIETVPNQADRTDSGAKTGSQTGSKMSAGGAESRRIVLTSGGEDDRTFFFDGETPVSLNGESTVAASLKNGDSIDVQYWSDEAGAHASALDAKRELTTNGTVVSFDVAQQQLTYSTDGVEMAMPVAADCAITINGRSNLTGRRVILRDLMRDDEIVTLKYDVEALSIDVLRGMSDIAEVWSVDAAENRLNVVIDTERVDVSTDDATVRYGDNDVDLSFLRRGDRLLIAHDSPDHTDLKAAAIEVTELVRDTRLIAMVISQQVYEGIQITPYKYATRDGELVRDAFDTGARVPEEQLTLLKDLPRHELVQAISRFFELQENREQLVVYFVGQAYVDLNTDTTYLAASDFRFEDMAGNGLKLRDLLTAMEQFQAREKVLILDTCHKVSAFESQSQPATGEQVRKTMVGDVVSRSVIVLGSCDSKRDVVVDDEAQHGQFAMQLAQAINGSGDSNADKQVSGDEMYRYLENQLASVEQEPVRFQPDTRPPRLTREAAAAVRSLLAALSRSRTTDAFEARANEADRLCDGQPDALVAYALVKLKTGRTGESLDAFRSIMGAHPRALVAYHAAAYQHLAKKEWVAAANVIARMMRQISLLQNPSNAYVTHLLKFAGTSSGFLKATDTTSGSALTIETAAKGLAPELLKVYEAGRTEFTARYEQTPEAQRTSARRFYRFDYDQVQQYMLDRLD